MHTHPVQCAYPEPALRNIQVNVNHRRENGRSQHCCQREHRRPLLRHTIAESDQGYLVPALSRPNLAVLTGAYVRRLLTKIKGEVVATGVEFEHDGKIHTVNVSREALLCAGYVPVVSIDILAVPEVPNRTIKSPHVLELSGIGDKNVLEPLGIPVQLDLPSVGMNLQDHVIFTGSVVCKFM